MEMRRLFFISSIFLALNGWAQTDAVADTIQDAKRLLTPSIYLDYGKLLTIPSNIETKYEGGIELLLSERFPIIGEFGSGTLTPEGAYANGTYESTGTYFRIGAGYLSQHKPKNKIGISFRYARSTFDETGRISIESPSGAQSTLIRAIDRKGLQATWWEAVLYTDRYLLKDSELLSIGVIFRLRVLQSYDEQPEVDVYAIPGYGRALDTTVPVANFFLKVNF